MLPVIDLPTYELKLPSTGQLIKVRPFRVKEEKLLLIAAESNDNQEIINTTKQVIQNCIVFGDLEIDKLPFFDIDYLFIALRAKSVGESIEIKFTCNNNVSDLKCGNVFAAQIDITNCKVKGLDQDKMKIELGQGITLKMKYPTYAALKLIVETKIDIDKEMHIIAACVETIVDKDKVYTIKDITKDELIAFIGNLSQEQYKKLSEFVNEFPSFVVETTAKCDKCGYTHRLEYRNFESFFA